MRGDEDRQSPNQGRGTAKPVQVLWQFDYHDPSYFNGIEDGLLVHLHDQSPICSRARQVVHARSLAALSVEQRQKSGFLSVGTRAMNAGDERGR